ncbi:MAG: extensin family protein [Polyangiaceae bacterium]|nr:extensin family protein [Polyangiaceae bacterium]
MPSAPLVPRLVLVAIVLGLVCGCWSTDERLPAARQAQGALCGPPSRRAPGTSPRTEPARAPSAPVIAAPSLDASDRPTPPEPGRANEDPDDDDVVGPPEPIADCEARLQAAGIQFKGARLPVHRERGIECGTPQAIEYRRGPRGLKWRPVPIVSCGLALALARFETALDEEAQRELGVGISAVEQGGTYSCRPMARFRMVSEHSYANAIDLRAFRTTQGRRIAVVDHFGKPDREPPSAEGRFLRQLARRLYDDAVFSVVVTRFFDEIHRDHIHVDLARYRVDGTR